MALLGQACVTDTILRVENNLLKEENRELRRVVEHQPDPGVAVVYTVDLDGIASLLTASGRSFTHDEENRRLVWTCNTDGSSVEAEIRWFPDSQVAYLGTRNLLNLSDVRDESATILLLTQIATIDFETLIGKLQLDPQSGEIVFSVELPAHHGLYADTLMWGMDRLCMLVGRHRQRLGVAADVGNL